MKRLLSNVKYAIFCLTAILSVQVAMAQAPRTIKGQVLDNTGLPMIGATVVVVGNTSVGTTTDMEGKFTIKASQNDVLSFSFLGYTEVSEKVGNRTTINVVLNPDNVSINEVVVIGYGTQAKSDLTGAVTSVNMEDLASTSLTSVDQALQGRMAGVEISTTDGEPGSAASIRIRGSRSISASNEPLIVVDGVMDAVESFSDIDPSDIKSVTVLKDASSTAIYGSRGANGVILVTTNEAKGTKLNVTFKATFGLSELPRELDIMSAEELARARNDYQINRDLDSSYLKRPSELSYDNPSLQGQGTDWLDVMTQKAFSQAYYLSLAGGGKNTKVFFSVNYKDNDGIVINTGQQHLTARLKLDHNATKWMKMGINLNYQTRHNDQAKTGINGTGTTVAIALNPLLAPDATWNNSGDSATNGGSVYNSPYLQAIHITHMTNRNYLTMSPYLEFTLTKGLKLKSTFSYSYFNTNRFYYSPSFMPVAASRKYGGTARRQETINNNLLSETTLSYNRTFKKTHKVNIVAGFTAQNKRSDVRNTEGVGYLDDNVSYYNMGSIVDKRRLTETTSATEIQRFSVLARANYSYKSRYHVTFTGRYDGSSNFSKGNKWAFFPALAFKWSINNESFMSNVGNWLTDLSLRLSAGRSGNDAVSSYVSQMALTTNTSGWLFGDTQEVAYYPTRLDNPDLTWEKTDSYNVGIDFSVLDNRVSFSLEGYYAKTHDLLLSIQNPQVTGYNTRYENIGSTQNIGGEFSITSRNITRANFQWTTNLTISHNTSKVLDLGMDYDYIATYEKNGIMCYGYVEGYPANSLWGFKYGGVWHNKGEQKENEVTKTYVSYGQSLGYSKYIDVNHDGVLDDNDRVYLGTADPFIYGGFNNTFRIVKNLQIGVYFTYSLGGRMYNPTEFEMGNTRMRTNKYRYMMDAWHATRNPYSDIPALGHTDDYPSDRYVHDASYFRLQNVNVSYTFDLRKKTRHLRDITLSAACNNVFLVSKYNGFDPDVSNGTARIDRGWYPKNRTYTFSIQIRY